MYKVTRDGRENDLINVMHIDPCGSVYNAIYVSEKLLDGMCYGVYDNNSTHNFNQLPDSINSTPYHRESADTILILSVGYPEEHERHGVEIVYYTWKKKRCDIPYVNALLLDGFNVTGGV